MKRPPRWLFQVYPPFLGAGIRARTSPDWDVADVEMKLRWWTSSVEFDRPQAYVDFLRDIAGAINAMLAAQPAEVPEHVWLPIGQAAARFNRDDGSVSIPLNALCVSGRRP